MFLKGLKLSWAVPRDCAECSLVCFKWLKWHFIPTSGTQIAKSAPAVLHPLMAGAVLPERGSGCPCSDLDSQVFASRAEGRGEAPSAPSLALCDAGPQGAAGAQAQSAFAALRKMLLTPSQSPLLLQLFQSWELMTHTNKLGLVSSALLR